jgi:hypothetical protein
MSQIYDMGPTALLLLRKKACFLSPSTCIGGASVVLSASDIRGAISTVGVWRGSACCPMGVLFNEVVCWSLGFEDRGSWSVGLSSCESRLLVGTPVGFGLTAFADCESPMSIKSSYQEVLEASGFPTDFGGSVVLMSRSNTSGVAGPCAATWAQVQGVQLKSGRYFNISNLFTTCYITQLN